MKRTWQRRNNRKTGELLRLKFTKNPFEEVNNQVREIHLAQKSFKTKEAAPKK